MTQKNRIPLAEALADVLPKGKFWTDRWHLVSGCTKKTPGCRECWLEAEARIRQHNPHPTFQTLHAGLLTPDGHWNGIVRMNEHLLDLPLKPHKKTKVWTIWADLFHAKVSDDFRDRVFATMALQQQDWFVIVTKWPEVAANYLIKGFRRGIIDQYAYETCRDKMPIGDFYQDARNWPGITWPPKNVIILVTMEDQERVHERLPIAAEIADLGWTMGILSEPLLSDISYRWAGGDRFMDGTGRSTEYDALKRMSWVITGGESGRNARPAHPGRVRKLRDQAQAAGVPFVFKQWGEFLCSRQCSTHLDEIIAAGRKTAKNHRFDDGTCVWMVGKKAAGRTLDGKEHMEVPNV